MIFSFCFNRQQIDTKQVDLSDENVDKACLSVSSSTGESVVHAVNQPNPQPRRDGEWSDIQATEARIADVREVSPETEERSSLDIPVVNNSQWTSPSANSYTS